MGVAAYNAECRKIVMRYSKEWEVRRCVSVWVCEFVSELVWIHFRAWAACQCMCERVFPFLPSLLGNCESNGTVD